MTAQRTFIDMPALHGGISHQRDHIKFPTQVDDAENVVFSVAEGAIKRPGTRFVKEISGLAASGNYRLHAINRDGNERYLVLYADSTIRVFEPYVSNAAAFEATVNITNTGEDNAQSYIDANNATADDFRLVSIADFTFILNTTVSLATEAHFDYVVSGSFPTFESLTSHTPGIVNTAWRTQEDSDSARAGYYLYIDYGSTFATAMSAELSSSGGAYKSSDPSDWVDGVDGSDTTHVGFSVLFQRVEADLTAVSYDDTTKTLTKAGAFAGFTLSGSDYINITGGTGINAGWYQVISKTDNTLVIASSAGTDTNDMTTDGIGPKYDISASVIDDEVEGVDDSMFDVAARLNQALQSAGATDGRIAWLPTTSGKGKFQITSPFRGTTASIYIAETSGTGDEFQDLADTGFPFESPTITDGTGTVAEADRTLPVPERWLRLAAPGQREATITKNNMPVEMVRTSVSSGATPAVFDISVVDWEDRTSGDEVTNPVPGPWRDEIRLTSIGFLNDRLVLAGNEHIVFSEQSDLFDLFLQDHANIVDSDPVEVTLSSDRVTLIDFIVPHRSTLQIFTKAGRQFELDAGQAITPSSISIVPTTSYLTASIRPKVMGDRIMAVGVAGDYSVLYEYSFDDAAQSNRADDVTAHVPKLLPTTLRTLDTTANGAYLIETDGNTIYVYQTYFASTGRKEQSAWSRFTIPDTFRLVDVALIENDLWLLIEDAEGQYVLERMPLVREAAESGFPYVVHLDGQHELTGSYDAGDDETTWTLPIDGDSTINAIVLGNDFGGDAGKVLTPDSVSGTAVKIAGDYSDGPVKIGRLFDMSIDLPRPYMRLSDGRVDLRGRTNVLSITTSHLEAGTYSLVATQSKRATRTRTFDAGDGEVADEGVFEALLNGDAKDMSITITSTDPRPVALCGIRYSVLHNQGVM